MLPQIHLLIFSLLIFPGLIFTLSLGLFTEWYIRKFVARLQSRMGPSYVGPFGILQPLADLIKLLSVKEEIKQRLSSLRLAKAFAFLGIGAAVVSLLLLPISPYRLIAPYDFLIYIYLCCIWIPFSLIMMSLSMPNPFTSIGISRLLSIFVVSEPIHFTAMIIPVMLSTHLYGSYCEAPYSMICASRYGVWLWTNPALVVPMALALIAVLVTLQARAMFQPFNIPEAEQEIIAGFATEFSGPILAFNNLLHDIDIAITLVFIVYVFLGGPYPFPHLSVQGVLILIVKYLALLTLISIIKASFGRFRIEQGIKSLLKYGGVPVGIALILTTVLLYIKP